MFSPNGKYIVTASDDGTAKIYEMNNTNAIRTIKFGRRVSSALFSPNDRYILISSYDGIVNIYSISANKIIGTIQHTSRLNSAVFSPDGSYIIAAFHDGTVKIQSASFCSMPDLQVLAVATLIELANKKITQPLSQDGWVYKEVMKLSPEERNRLFEEYKEAKDLMLPSFFGKFIHIIKLYVSRLLYRR